MVFPWRLQRQLPHRQRYHNKTKHRNLYGIPCPGLPNVCCIKKPTIGKRKSIIIQIWRWKLGFQTFICQKLLGCIMWVFCVFLTCDFFSYSLRCMLRSHKTLKEAAAARRQLPVMEAKRKREYRINPLLSRNLCGLWLSIYNRCPQHQHPSPPQRFNNCNITKLTLDGRAARQSCK